jgi:GT2 family glycosyltransferase
VPAPTIAVVIPSYRRLARLAPLVALYLRHGVDEVVVVLDGPHPGWREALADVLVDPVVSVVELPENGGLALARIAGLRAATADIILIADDDVTPGPHAVAGHREAHADGRDSVLLGYMPVALPARRGADQSPTFLYAREYESQVRVWRSASPEIILGSLWGGAVSLPRTLYERAEAFKPSQRLNYNEDLDLGLRLIALGATASFDDRVAAAHHHDRGLVPFLRECFVRGQAIADLEERWGSIPAQLLPLVTIPAGYSRIGGAVQRRIAARDSSGALEALLTAVYRGAGLVRGWRVQDAVSRLVRRGLMMRGYRLTSPSGSRALSS